MDYCQSQDKECIIIFGGDACDRGPDGYKIIKELLNNPKVIYLKGNHEDIFVCAARLLHKHFNGPYDKASCEKFLDDCLLNHFYDRLLENCIANGGRPTLISWLQDGAPIDILDKIQKLPLTFSYEKLDFSHAGGDPRAFIRASKCEHEGEFVDLDDETVLIWDRANLRMGWISNRIGVFGHTPVCYLPPPFYNKYTPLDQIHPCAYKSDWSGQYQGWKLAMDTGAVASDIIYVLNCLTLTAEGFKAKNNEVKHFDTIRFKELM